MIKRGMFHHFKLEILFLNVYFMNLHKCTCIWGTVTYENIEALGYCIASYILVLTGPFNDKQVMADDTKPSLELMIDWWKTRPREHLWITWWRHQMETFSALLALCAGNSPVTGEFPAPRPVTRSFDVFFDLRLNKRLSKQSWGWWFETPLCSLWRHCSENDRGM